MALLKVVTYNTHQEKAGRDPALDSLLAADDALICLQEVSPLRALWVKLVFRGRAFVSPGRHGLQYLATVLPRGTRFAARRTVQLNGHLGLVPAVWSVRRAWGLRCAGEPGWRDCFEPRIAQRAGFRWEGTGFQVVNTHLALENGLRNKSLSRLSKIFDRRNALLAGDLNATRDDLFLRDLMLAGRLRMAGPEAATHSSGRRIDYVLHRGGFLEVAGSVKESLSDHRILEVELEV